MDYVCRLLRAYPGFTTEYVMDCLPMDQGWAFYAWAIENDGWLQFSGMKREGDGYIMQEARKLTREALPHYR